MRADRGRRRHCEARQDIERLPVGRGVRRARSGSDVRRIVAGHVRDDERERTRPRRRREATSLDEGQVLPHRVHVLDGRTARQEIARQRLEVGHRHALDGKREERGAAAGYQHEKEVVLAERAREGEDIARGVLALLVGHRMARLDDADALGGEPVAVASDDDPLERPIRGPMGLDRERHGRRRLARADDDGSSARRRRQVGGDDACRVGCGEGRLEAAEEELAGIHRRDISYNRGAARHARPRPASAPRGGIMANPLTKAPEKHEPPPFWAQLPMVFTYPAHGDAIVKIVSFSIAAAIAESFLPLGWLWSALVWLAFLAFCFRTLERTALGHLVPAEFTTEDRVNPHYRPLKQVLLL